MCRRLSRKEADSRRVASGQQRHERAPSLRQRKAEKTVVNAERLRLDEADSGGVPWSRWGPYLSEWQWGTVREDYGSGDLWNGRHPIQKERLFGLTNAEGNHGEDVKECYGYFHGDNGAGIGASHQTGWTGTA